MPKSSREDISKIQAQLKMLISLKSLRDDISEIQAFRARDPNAISKQAEYKQNIGKIQAKYKQNISISQGLQMLTFCLYSVCLYSAYILLIFMLILQYVRQYKHFVGEIMTSHWSTYKHLRYKHFLGKIRLHSYWMAYYLA